MTLYSAGQTDVPSRKTFFRNLFKIFGGFLGHCCCWIISYFMPPSHWHITILIMSFEFEKNSFVNFEFEKKKFVELQSWSYNLDCELQVWKIAFWSFRAYLIFVADAALVNFSYAICVISKECVVLREVCSFTRSV